MSLQPDAKPVGVFRGKLVLDPNPGQFGPAMKALRPRARDFVIAYLADGGRNASDAYRASGYLISPNTLRSSAHRLLHDPKVQLAIQEEGRKRIVSGGPMAIETIVEVMQNPTASNKDRLRAAEMVANRAGLHATTEHRVTVEHSLDTAGMVEKIRLLAAELGEDPEKFLGDQTMLALPKPEDAEFEDVDPDDISDIL